MADLGSGDGRIVTAFADIGVEAHGYELDTELVRESKENIFRQKISHATIHGKDFWEEDLSVYDIITTYPMPDIMGALEQKLWRELLPGTRVLLNYYPFVSWHHTDHKNHIYLYIR